MLATFYQSWLSKTWMLDNLNNGKKGSIQRKESQSLLLRVGVMIEMTMKKPKMLSVMNGKPKESSF